MSEPRPKFSPFGRGHVKWKKSANRPAGEGYVIEVHQPKPGVYRYKVQIWKPKALSKWAWMFEEDELTLVQEKK
jgi:hypothetical protein